MLTGELCEESLCHVIFKAQFSDEFAHELTEMMKMNYNAHISCHVFISKRAHKFT